MFFIPRGYFSRPKTTLKMTTAQVVETSVTVNNSPIQDYVLPDDPTLPTLHTFFLTWSGLVLSFPP